MALVDDALSTINASLLANIDWLDAAYGKVQRMVEDRNGREVFYPGIYVGGDLNRYLNLLPDSHIGCYTYVDVDEKVEYENISTHIRPKFTVKLVVWFHWPTLYPSDWQSRSIEEVKATVLNVLTGTSYTHSVENFVIYEDARSIYKGYSHKEVESQFLMREFGGFAIEFEVIGSAACSIDLPTPTIPADLFGLVPVQYSLTAQVYPLMKWIDGTKIYFQTWYFAEGTGDYVTLTGYDMENKRMIPNFSSMTFINQGSGDQLIQSVHLEADGDGIATVNTLDFAREIFITIFWRPI